MLKFGVRRKGDLRMCEMIKKANSLTPEKTLEEYWDKKIPVNVKNILAGVGIRFRKNDFSELERALEIDKDDAILGLAFSDGDDLGILFSSQIDRDSANYVLAHEFAHCCLHLAPHEQFHVEMKMSSDLYSDSHNKTIRERHNNSHKELQADKFAANLLIPTKPLIDYLSKNKEQRIEDVARHFHVPKEIIRLKIMSL